MTSIGAETMFESFDYDWDRLQGLGFDLTKVQGAAEPEQPCSSKTFGAMAINQLRVIREKVDIMLEMMDPDTEMEPWMSTKITMSAQNLASVADYMRFGVEFAESLDFTLCQRPDGSTYGSRGKCKKGTEVGAKEEDKAGPKKPKAKAKKEETGGPVPSRAEVKELTSKAKEFTYGKPWTKDHQEVWDRILSSSDTKKLGSLARKLNKEVFDDYKYDVSAGFMKGAMKLMKEWLESNQRSGLGAAKQAKLEAMSPEERRRAASAERIERGIRGGVVSGRMR